MTRAARELIAISLGIVVVVALVQCAREPKAHGAAHWIADNPGYVDQDATHCCGPADCNPDHEAKFRETPAGIEITTGAGDVILVPWAWRGKGLYASLDGRWWVCIRGGKVKCVFRPSSPS